MSVTNPPINSEAPITFNQYCDSQTKHNEQALDQIEIVRGSILDKLSAEDIKNCEKLCKVKNILINHPPKSWGRVLGEITLAALGALLMVGGGAAAAYGLFAVGCSLFTTSAAVFIPMDGIFACVGAAMGLTGTCATAIGAKISFPAFDSMNRGINLCKKAFLERSLGKEKVELFNQLVKLYGDQAIFKGYTSKSIRIFPVSPIEHKTSYFVADGTVYTKPVKKGHGSI